MKLCVGAEMWCSVDSVCDLQVRKRETKKQEEEQLAEIVEAKDLAKKGMLSIIGEMVVSFICSSVVANFFSTNENSFH